MYNIILILNFSLHYFFYVRIKVFILAPDKLRHFSPGCAEVSPVNNKKKKKVFILEYKRIRV